MATLCKHTQLKFFSIKEPRYRDRVVLLRDSKLGKDNKIVFTNCNWLGNKPYYVSRAAAHTYPTELMPTKEGGEMKVRAIPVGELEDLEFPERCEHDYK